MRGIAKLSRVAGWLCVGVLGLASAAAAAAEKPSQRHAELVQRLADTKADRAALTSEVRMYENLAMSVARWTISDREAAERARQELVQSWEQTALVTQRTALESRGAADASKRQSDAEEAEVNIFVQPDMSRYFTERSELVRFVSELVDALHADDLAWAMADLERDWLPRIESPRSRTGVPDFAGAIRDSVSAISSFRNGDDDDRRRMLFRIMVRLDSHTSRSLGQEAFWEERPRRRPPAAPELEDFPFYPEPELPPALDEFRHYQLHRELHRVTRRLGAVGFEDLPDEVHRLRMRVADRRSLLSGVEAEIERLSQEIEAAEAALHDAAAGLLDGSTVETDLGESVSFGVRGDGASALVMTVNDRDYTLIVRPEMRRRTPPVFAARADGGSPDSIYNFKTETDAFSVPALDRRRAFVFVGLLSIEVESSEGPVDHRSVMRWFKAAADLEALAAL